MVLKYACLSRTRGSSPHRGALRSVARSRPRPPAHYFWYGNAWGQYMTPYRFPVASSHPRGMVTVPSRGIRECARGEDGTRGLQVASKAVFDMSRGSVVGTISSANAY